MKILVTMPAGYTRESFLGGEVREALSGFGEIEWNQGDRNWNSQELSERLAGVDVCITGWGTVRFDSTVLEKADRLKLVVHTGGSVAGIVSPEFYARNIRIVSGNPVYARSVAEGVISYALMALRRLPHYLDIMYRKHWREDDFSNEGLLDQTVGLIGCGQVAHYLIPMLHAFSCRIKIYSSHLTSEEAKKLGAEKASLEDIVKTCKIISVHSALTEKTYHLLSRDLLAKMQDHALLINTARGAVIDEAALADICAKKPVSAVLDVYEAEPLPETSPLRKLDNVLLIPHMAGPTIDQRLEVGRRLCHEIQLFSEGKPLTMECSAEVASRMTHEGLKK